MAHKMRILLSGLIILLCVPKTEETITGTLTVFKTAVDVFKSGFQIVEFIRKLNSDQTDGLREMLEDIRTDLSQMISSSTTKIIKEITLQNKLERIEDTVSEIKSLLIDLRNYIEAENEMHREDYKSLFLRRFDQRVVSQIRNLPSLLTYTIPGLSEPLIDLIVDKAQCNMTSIHEFQMFYAKLLTDGSTLQLVYRELLKMTSVDVEDFWKNEQLPRIQGQFDGMETTCKQRFPKSAAKEIKEHIEARALYNNSKQRYTWAWCDVFYYAPMGTHQLHFHKSVKEFMFWNEASSSGTNQIMVIGDLDKIPHSWNKNDMNTHSSFRSAIIDSEDESAALKIGNAVEKFVKGQGFQIKGIVVFFDTMDLAATARIIDSSSPAAYVVLEGVTVKYCYNSGFACAITRWESFNFNSDWKEYTGRFHIYVFPGDESNSSFYTGSSNSITQLFPALYLACLTLVIVTKIY